MSRNKIWVRTVTSYEELLNAQGFLDVDELLAAVCLKPRDVAATASEAI